MLTQMFIFALIMTLAAGTLLAGWLLLSVLLLRLTDSMVNADRAKQAEDLAKRNLRKARKLPAQK